MENQCESPAVQNRHSLGGNPTTRRVTSSILYTMEWCNGRPRKSTSTALQWSVLLRISAKTQLLERVTRHIFYQLLLIKIHVQRNTLDHEQCSLGVLHVQYRDSCRPKRSLRWKPANGCTEAGLITHSIIQCLHRNSCIKSRVCSCLVIVTRCQPFRQQIYHCAEYFLLPVFSDFRQHRMHSMRPITVDDPVAWCLSLSVCNALALCENGSTDRALVWGEIFEAQGTFS